MKKKFLTMLALTVMTVCLFAVSAFAMPGELMYVNNTNGTGVNMRSGPGTGFDRVGSLNSGDDVDILFQIEIGDTAWGCIGVGKWICMDYVGMG